MLELDFTFVWTILNLLLLYWLLRKFLFKPLTKFMEDRENSVVSAIADGAAKKAEGEEYKLKHQNKFQQAEKDIEALMEQAQKRANAEYDSIIAAAKRDSEALLAKAAADIERERDSMLREIRDDVLHLSLAAASRVLSKVVDTEENRAIVEEFIKNEGAA